MRKKSKKMKWGNLKKNLCPICDFELSIGLWGMCVCNQCFFKIDLGKFESLRGHQKRDGAKEWHVDGFLHGPKNPSSFGGGYTITDNVGTVIERTELRAQDMANKVVTNNDAEVAGIIRTLQLASEGDLVCSDSQCAIIWVRAGFARKRPDLFKVLSYGKSLLNEKKIALEWTSRWKSQAGLYNDMIKEKGYELEQSTKQ